MAIVKPDVSVIIATYNRLWALPKAIESCRNSNCRAEIVVVDDGSTDETWSWLQSQTDVVSIRTDNWGQCWALARGVAASTGEFIRFLEDDDWILDGANDLQLEIARATDADVVVAGYEIHDQIRDRIVDVPWVYDDDFLVGQIHTDCCYSAYLTRRSLVARIPQREEYPHHDSTFLLELALTKPTVAIGQFASVAYRIHASDRQSDRSGLHAAMGAWRTIVLYRKILKLIEERGECTALRKDAFLRALWHEARKLAEWNIKEATAIVEWVRHQDERFRPPVGNTVNLLYRLLGFGLTERIARVRRALKRVSGFQNS